MSSRVSCAKALSEITAVDVFIVPKLWKYKRIEMLSQVPISSALYSPMRQLDRDLTLWAAQKYKKLRKHLRRASHWLASIRKRTPALFAHWQLNARHGSAMGAV